MPPTRGTRTPLATGLVVAILAACGGEHALIDRQPTAPPAEQTRLASVERLFGEGRPVDHPAVAPHGDSLAFVGKFPSGSGVRLHIHVSDLRGRVRRRLTTVAGSNSSPCWDPTGRWIAYATIRSGHWDIWRVALDGSFDQPLTDDPFEDQDPAVSPDGRRLVFASRRDTTRQPPAFDLWELELASGELRQLTRSDGDDRRPQWSPDGSALAWHLTVADSTSRLVRLDLASGVSTLVTDPGGANDVEPCWSPDGRRLVFASDRGGSWDLWVVDAAGAAAVPVPVTDSRWNDRFPRFIPGSPSFLVFVSDRGGEPGIWRAWNLPTL